MKINNQEFRTLILQTYGRQIRFCRETGYTPQHVNSWWTDQNPVPRIVILYLQQRLELIGLLCAQSNVALALARERASA